MRIKNKMNRRGDIPITILVIGILAICLLAIFSFYFSDRNVKNDFLVVKAVEEARLAKEKIDFYEHLRLKGEDVEDFIKIESDGQGKFINVTSQKINVRYNLPN